MLRRGAQDEFLGCALLGSPVLSSSAVLCRGAQLVSSSAVLCQGAQLVSSSAVLCRGAQLVSSSAVVRRGAQGEYKNKNNKSWNLKHLDVY